MSSLAGKLAALWQEPSTLAGLLLQRLLASRQAGHRRRFAAYRGLLVYLFGIHIAPDAQIGRNLRFAHPTGVVIGAGAVIGDDVVLYQHVTLGARDRHEGRYPRVGDRVVVFAGAVLLGGITVCDDAVIGANAVVLDDVAPGAVVAGNPARRIR